MSNYELKSQVLENGLAERVKYLMRVRSYFEMPHDKEYFQKYNLSDDEYRATLDEWSFLVEKRPDELQEAIRVVRNGVARTSRLRVRVSKIIQKPSVFLTLTFRDDVLTSTSENTRHAYVKRFLKDINVPYVANIDYGAKNEREHYHALVQSVRIDYSKWKYGAINGQKIHDIKKSVKALPKYINKLANHAIKKTTKQNRIIYSRETDSMKQEVSFQDALNFLDEI